jgi:hypothetical protein
MIPELEPVALQELRALGSPKTWSLRVISMRFRR